MRSRAIAAPKTTLGWGVRPITPTRREGGPQLTPLSRPLKEAQATPLKGVKMVLWRCVFSRSFRYSHNSAISAAERVPRLISMTVRPSIMLEAKSAR